MGKKYIFIFVGIVMGFSINMPSILEKMNSLKMGVFIIYKENQYFIHNVKEEEIHIKVQIADSIGKEKSFETKKVQIQLIDEEGEHILPKQYDIEEVGNKLGCSLYNLNICLENEGKIGTNVFTQLKIDNNQYDIGNVVVKVQEKEESVLDIRYKLWMISNLYRIQKH